MTLECECDTPADAEALGQAQTVRLMMDLQRLYSERNEALQAVTRAHHEALMRLALAAEYRDGDTGIHIVRMGMLAEGLALARGEKASWAAMLRKSAPMHDVGKIGIPDEVLKKPGGLTPQERQVMNEHPIMGARILGGSKVPLFQLAAEVALTHHERWDGSGYPNRVSGTDIALHGRIVAVVDYFDALTMDRCYRPAFSDDQALSMLESESGRAFDPDLVALFLREAPALCALRDRINAQHTSFESLILEEPLAEAFA